jgi:sulfate permease, SulP family
MSLETQPKHLTIFEQFVPKILTVLKEGYGPREMRADAVAGLTVAIVALPLSMAIAIASGVGPQVGLFSAIVGGTVVSALGGSRFQIGGPAGAFIVLVSACVADIGMAGLATTCLLAGAIMILAGALRVGTYVKFIPYPVTVGFTAGIGAIILASQMKDAFGLSLPGAEPGALLPKLQALWDARATIEPAALALTLASLGGIIGLKKLRPTWPALLIVVVLSGAIAAGLDLPVQTIASRFGQLPGTLPAPSLPALDHAALVAAFPYAVSFALLGAIESLLSAVVADGMTGRHHRSNAELVAQGIANIASPVFGGMVVTGTIARTATNVRAGAHGPMAGIFHAGFVMLAMFIFAPLAGHIPLAALAAVLITVAWNMIEKHEAWALMRNSRGDALVLLATFLLVVFRDLTEGILVGFALGSILFIQRMSAAASVEARAPLAEADRPDGVEPYDATAAIDGDIVVYRIQGAFFFGAASTVGAVLDRISTRPRAFILDFAEVPFLDSTAARMIVVLGHKVVRHGGHLYLSGTDTAAQRTLVGLGLRAPVVRYMPTIDAALAAAREDLAVE